MTDQEKLEKVIKGLECCILGNKHEPDCDVCPYSAGCNDTCDTMDEIHGDALALLKSQEPVEPTEPDEDNMRYCGACGTPVGYEVLEPPGMDYIRYNYCPNCGRAVKWC